MNRATAYANANIALVKYWGKREGVWNIPIVPSISMTLNDLGTAVTVSFIEGDSHALFMEGQEVHSQARARAGTFLERMRQLHPFSGFIRVSSKATIPYASGLASSASFFAALTLAMSQLLRLDMSAKELSIMARIGSGSAARSMFGGFVGLYGGSSIDHNGSYAFPIEVHQELELSMVVAVVSDGPKAISSRRAMEITKDTSPFFKPFVEAQAHDVGLAQDCLRDGDFKTLGEIVEHSALKMHASMWASRPAINYWLPQTLQLMNLVYDLRKELGPVAYFTMDAGPHVKVLCPAKYLSQVADRISRSGYAERVLCSKPGRGAYLQKDHVS